MRIFVVAVLLSILSTTGWFAFEAIDNRHARYAVGAGLWVVEAAVLALISLVLIWSGAAIAWALRNHRRLRSLEEREASTADPFAKPS